MAGEIKCQSDSGVNLQIASTKLKTADGIQNV